MANPLRRIIKEGEIVVLREEFMEDEYKALEHRLFRVRGGFGMSPATIGNKISGEFVCDGEKTSLPSQLIDVSATRRYQEEHGDGIS